MDLLSLVPAPRAPLDWDAFRSAAPRIEALHDCPQDPTWHGEGDVGTHTAMVCEALAADPGWQALPEDERREVFLAAALHDLGKPACTRRDGDHVVSPGHARKGAVLARALLWEAGLPFAVRERICALVRHHTLPTSFVRRDLAQPSPDVPPGFPPRRIVLASQSVRCDHLALLALADARGRLADDTAEVEDQVHLFALACEEADCLHRARPFESGLARFLYARKPWRHPDAPVHDAAWGEAVLLSGLPGAGKDCWLGGHPDLPVVSLDALREELDVAAGDPAGPVVAAALERAKACLRTQRSFAWNATNLPSSRREALVDLVTAYGARARIVYVEVAAERLWRQNRDRPHPVPEAAIRRMMGQWQVPEAHEAPEVEWVVAEGGGADPAPAVTAGREPPPPPRRTRESRSPADPAGSGTPPRGRRPGP